jgi:hypothetical protein
VYSLFFEFLDIRQLGESEVLEGTKQGGCSDFMVILTAISVG